MKKLILALLLTTSSALGQDQCVKGVIIPCPIPTVTPTATSTPIPTPQALTKVSDFSYAGYREGTEIPGIPVVKNVKTDYGAKGDGVTDDTASFQNALANAPIGAILVPAGNYKISSRLVMDRPGIVLRGVGKESILSFTKSFKDLIGTITPPFNAYMYGQGGLLWVGKTAYNSAVGSQITTVTVEAKRGDEVITVGSTASLNAGKYIVIELNPPDLSFKKHLYGDHPNIPVNTSPAGVVPRWPVKIKSISGNKVTLNQKLRHDLKLKWLPVIKAYTPVTEIGVEKLWLKMPDIRTQGHHSEPGFNGLSFWGCMNCWAKDVWMFATDSGLDINYLSKHVTAKGIHVQARTLKNGNGYDGHHAISVQINSTDNLITDFSIDSVYHHAVDFTHFPNGNVIKSGWGRKLTMGHHMNAPFQNLWSDLQLGDPRWDGLYNPYGSSGGKGEGHAAQWNCFWNIRTNQGKIPCPQNFKDTYWVHSYADDFPASVVFPSTETRDDAWCFAEQGDPFPPELYQYQLGNRLE